MLRVELHCHTHYSNDGVTSPEALLRVCREKGVDRVVVTDHNTIEGALHAQRLDPERVIVGEEIMTSKGELLAVFVCEEIPPRLEPGEVIRRLRQQGAFISIPHPFDLFRSRWRLEDLLELVPLVDAIETHNSHCLWPGFNRQAAEFARQHGLPGTVGSDAHLPVELGKATLLLSEFHNATELRAVLLSARASIVYEPIWKQLVGRIRKRTEKLLAPP